MVKKVSNSNERLRELAVIDEMSKGISAKTLHNRYGLICSVLKEYAPQVDTNIELPKRL